MLYMLYYSRIYNFLQQIKLSIKVNFLSTQIAPLLSSVSVSYRWKRTKYRIRLW